MRPEMMLSNPPRMDPLEEVKEGIIDDCHGQHLFRGVCLVHAFDVCLSTSSRVVVLQRA